MPRLLYTSCTLLCVLFFTANSFAQDDDNADVTDVTKVTILNPGFSYEKKIGRNQTIYTQAFMNLSALAEGDFYGTTDYTFFLDPAFTAQYRYYYNLNKRMNNDRRTEMNSGNYVAAIYEGLFSRMPVSVSYSEESNRRLISRMGVVWGLQRNYAKRFSLDLNIGLGYLAGKSSVYDYSSNKASSTMQGAPSMMGQVNIGFWLNKQ